MLSLDLFLPFLFLSRCFLPLLGLSLVFILRLCLLTLVGVDELPGNLLFTRDAFDVELLPHAVWVECSFAPWALPRFLVQIENLLAHADGLELWQ